MDRENVMSTCGVCFGKVINTDIPLHSCLQGYEQFHYDEETSHFYPLTDDNVLIRCKIFDGKKEVVLQNLDDFEKEKTDSSISKKLSNKSRQKATLSFDDEEVLILEVRAREPLWNFQLNIQERNTRITNKLWNEVSQALGGKISAEGAKQKFKSLHDTYRKIIQAENLASGSVRKNLDRKWRHYESMDFLRDSCLIKQTVSNMCSVEAEHKASNINDEDKTSSNESSRKRKRERKEKDYVSNSALEKIADALINQEPALPLPPPPQVDKVDAFLIMLGHRIRKLPEEKQVEAMQSYLQLSVDYLKKH